MREKIPGLILCVVGIAGLIVSLIYISVIGDPGHAVLLLAGGIFGAVSFFLGLRIMPYAGKITEKPLKINIVPRDRTAERTIVQQP